MAKPGTKKQTISLPALQARFIEKKVASGTYASASEVVRAGLRALQERDAAIARWLTDEVAPTYDKMKAQPDRAVTAEKAHSAIRARHAARLKAGRREP